MLTRVLVAAVTAIALAVPPADAQPLTVDCAFDAGGYETLTGGQDTFTGVARGYVVSGSPGNSVSIACYIRVDGVFVAGTPTGTGNTVAATVGQLTYTASDTQAVDLCSSWSDGAASGMTCIPFCPVCIFLPGGVFCFWVPCAG